MKKYLKITIISVFICLVSFSMGIAESQPGFDDNENLLRNTGLGNNDPVTVVASIINWFLGILGLLALCLIIYGGFIWMFSRGNEEEIKKARDILKSAAIGLTIILASYGIASYVFNNLVNITTG